jgi:hypothetical protein
MPPPIFDLPEFANIKTTHNHRALEAMFGTKVIQGLIPFLEQTILGQIPSVRALWTKPSSKTAFSDEIKTDIYQLSPTGSSTGAWYVFNNGGRNELQFNIGMDARWLRVGLAFQLGRERYGDPAAVDGLLKEFKDAVRADKYNFEKFVTANNIEIDWYSDALGSAGQIPTGVVVNVLLTAPIKFSWLFVGRLLRPTTKDLAILRDANRLGQLMTTVFDGLWPYYLKAQKWGHGHTAGKYSVRKRRGPAKSAGTTVSTGPASSPVKQASSRSSPKPGKT